jgi:phosphate transport system substrate-binding protein
VLNARLLIYESTKSPMLFRHKKNLFYLGMMAALAVGLASCGSEETAVETGSEVARGGEGLDGTIEMDGSSTVFPITEAMAEEFQATYPNVRITVGVSGTGGGFEKFCNGETAISGASRPIKESEIQACEEAGISFVELPVANDAIAVVANPENDWAECLTAEELETIWKPDAQGTVNNWNQVRADFPDRQLSLYGPGTDSGTFDYFTDAIVGEEGASRGDYTASEDDNVIVQGVANDVGAIGYFGLAYLEENQDRLKAITVDNLDPSDGEGCIAPSAATVDDGTYQPLARPIFIYVSIEAAERPEVQEFVQFYLNPTNAESLVFEVGYIPLSTDLYEQLARRFENRATGSIFGGGSTVGVNLKEEYRK